MRWLAVLCMGAVFATGAIAQTSTPEVVEYAACEITTPNYDRNAYPPVVATRKGDDALSEVWRDKAIEDGFPAGKTRVRCHADADRSYVEGLRAGWVRQSRQQGLPVSEPAWTYEPSAQPLRARRLTLMWKSRAKAEGYHSATIDLVYTFIRCADKIQVAYSIDRASFRVTGAYVVSNDGQPRTATDAGDPPPAPPSVWMTASVWDSGGRNLPIRRIEDRFAGESLGMGCIDGKTREIGTVVELVGKDATPATVKRFLAGLELLDGFVEAGPLLRAGDAEGAAAEADRRQAEDAARDAAALKAANEAIAAKAKAETARIEAAKAEFVRQRAEYERGVAAAAAAKAQYDRDKAANEADVARYRQQRATYEAGELAAGRVPKQ